MNRRNLLKVAIAGLATMLLPRKTRAAEESVTVHKMFYDSPDHGIGIGDGIEVDFGGVREFHFVIDVTDEGYVLSNGSVLR